MNETTILPDIASGRIRRASFLDRLARKALGRRLGRIRLGAITLVNSNERRTYGCVAGERPLHATVVVRDPRFYSAVVFGGSISAGESYMDGHWSCDDLTTLVRILLRNRSVLDGMETGFARLSAPFNKLVHLLRRNTKEGSRSNIAAHYDLGNEFFSLFLDETMMYSCAFFDRKDSTLLDASIAKNARICKKLRLSPEDHLLEIGTGWGSFAIQAARDYGCRITTTTISRQQHDFALQRIKEAGLSDRITVLLKDYRDLRELNTHYDKIVSIEMIEAVGHAFYDLYFKCCSDLLKPHGQMLLQAITIQDQQYDRAKRSVDFIQRYIFPGSCIPSISAICNSVARVTDMRLLDLEDIGAHYPPTLRFWRNRLFANIQRVRGLGFSDSFVRMWEFYFSYCEGGFLERSISDVQMLFVKPVCRAEPVPLPVV